MFIPFNHVIVRILSLYIEICTLFVCEMHNLRKYIIYNDYLFDKKLSNTSNDPLETRIAVISTSEISSFTYSILRFELQMSAVFTEV